MVVVNLAIVKLGGKLIDHIMFRSILSTKNYNLIILVRISIKCKQLAMCVSFSAYRVVIPLCGGNIDTTVLGRCLERGLAADGRLCRFVVTVSDRPGGIAELTKRIANLGVG